MNTSHARRGLGQALLQGGTLPAWDWPGAGVTGKAAWGGQAGEGSESGPLEAFSHSLTHSFTH